MIEKDIVNNNPHMDKESESQSQIKNRVDDIFLAADQEMVTQNKASVVKFREKKKQKKHSLIRFLASAFMAIVAFVIIVIIVGIFAIKASYPAIKENFLSQISVIQSNLSKLDDSELTAEQRYQKQVFLLFSADELDSMLGSIEDIENFSQIFNHGGTIDSNLVPEDKKDEYEKIVEEYRDAIANQDDMEQQSTTVTKGSE